MKGETYTHPAIVQPGRKQKKAICLHYGAFFLLMPFVSYSYLTSLLSCGRHNWPNNNNNPYSPPSSFAYANFIATNPRRMRRPRYNSHLRSNLQPNRSMLQIRTIQQSSRSHHPRLYHHHLQRLLYLSRLGPRLQPCFALFGGSGGYCEGVGDDWTDKVYE